MQFGKFINIYFHIGESVHEHRHLADLNQHHGARVFSRVHALRAQGVGEKSALQRPGALGDKQPLLEISVEHPRSRLLPVYAQHLLLGDVHVRGEEVHEGRRAGRDILHQKGVVLHLAHRLPARHLFSFPRRGVHGRDSQPLQQGAPRKDTFVVN